MAVSNNVRSVIELFCKILADNEISDVRAETLRQGKFNRDVITKMMWKVLYEVVCFLDKKSVASLSEAEQIPFVKKKMQNWGYLSKSFAELHSSLVFGSREILLALGWVIHTQHLFSEIISRRTTPMQQDLLSFTQRIPVDARHIPMHLPRDLPAKEKLQRQLMLCGKLKLKLRRLYASKQELAQLRETIHKCTADVSIQPKLNHLTPLEVYLLRYPESLGKMMSIIEEDNAQLKRLLEWKEKDHVFWEWVDSILTLHIQDQGDSNINVQEDFEEETVFLDTPPDIGNQLSNIRAHIRDFILSHEENIETLEALVLNKKVSPMEMELVKYKVEKELFELSSKFSRYDEGQCDIPHSVLEEDSILDASDISSNGLLLSGQRKGQRHQKYIPQTAQYVKACKETEVYESVQEEISALQKEVKKLEQELKQIQMNNLRQLQDITGQDSNSICILPRHFKQFLA